MIQSNQGVVDQIKGLLAADLLQKQPAILADSTVACRLPARERIPDCGESETAAAERYRLAGMHPGGVRDGAEGWRGR